MEKAVQLLDRYFSGPAVKLAEQRHLQAVRNGVISALPFIIVGSFFLIVAFPPVPEGSAIARWAEEHVREILIPYRLTMFIMSLYIVYGIGYNLAEPDRSAGRRPDFRRGVSVDHRPPDHRWRSEKCCP